ncbi:tRNA (guanosine(46)-N7)-methyltransferase TrmB [Bacteroidales bacterium OttesenSCG-928-C19]|nr:tRNA (guanosine(46)-N7)-methyltransferase TrmB [Bacteroidales bacterium OttesenSCG-928-C19]
MRFAENLTFPNMFQVSLDEVKASPFKLKGKWNQDFFKNDNPIVLELGCGKGEYTVGLAARYPDKNFIGVDIKGARMWIGCKESNEKQMPNVAFLRTRIEFIDYYFSENEVSEIWVTFPDPQPKKPNKRLTSERMLSLYRKIAMPNALYHLKTDSKELHDYTKDEVLLPEKYTIFSKTDDLYASDLYGEVKEIKTHYEQLFSEKGKKITYLSFGTR